MGPLTSRVDGRPLPVSSRGHPPMPLWVLIISYKCPSHVGLRSILITMC